MRLIELTANKVEQEVIGSYPNSYLTFDRTPPRRPQL